MGSNFLRGRGGDGGGGFLGLGSVEKERKNEH